MHARTSCQRRVALRLSSARTRSTGPDRNVGRTLSSGFKLHDSKYSPLLGGVLKLLESILCLSVINRRGIICSCSHCKNKLVKEGGEVKSHLISGTGAPSDGCKSWRTSNRKSTAKCFHRRQITGQGLIIWGRGHYHQVRVVLTQSGPRSLMICLLIGISNSCCALYISREGCAKRRGREHHQYEW